MGKKKKQRHHHMFGACRKGGEHEVQSFNNLDRKNLHCRKCGKFLMGKTSNRIKQTPTYLLDLKEKAEKEQGTISNKKSVASSLPAKSTMPAINSHSRHFTAEREYKQILEIQKPHNLQPLILGNFLDTIYGTISRWKYVVEALRRFEGHPPEVWEKFLAEVRKREMAPWWQSERGHFDKYFAHLIPQPGEAPNPSVSVQARAPVNDGALGL